ncbi:Mariner Mos1 transposase [Araneus ventricosus]|uniref:Mariner Mos1 transposase n=1 Tax=Araneus ventricosus TaxID=182803 RepID=A0A4Y2NL47_ARAVE|nr:Mariner Mos1 transposase [Araneus ventricosus]
MRKFVKTERYQKTKRLGSALTFLTRYSEEANEFLNKIVTGEVFTIPHKKNFKTTLSAHKIMCTVFWNRQGILLVEFLPRGEPSMRDDIVKYCENCGEQFKTKGEECSVKALCCFMTTHVPHSAGVTQNLIQRFGWEQFDHPPYSPELAPSDYHLFVNLKRDFGGRRSDSDDDARNVVQRWLSSLAASSFEDGIHKLVFRYDKCLNNGGNYVEK